MRFQTRWRLPMTVLVAVLAGACGPANERGDLGGQIASAVVEAGDGGIVDMKTVVDLDWDNMYAFSGYTTDDEVTEAIGVQWGSGDESQVPYDGQELVLFMKDGAVVAWSKLNAGAGPGGTAVRINHPSEAIPVEKARFRASLEGETQSGGDLFYLNLTAE